MLIQLIWTAFVEPYLGIVEWILNVCDGGFNSFGGAVANLIGNIISWFLSLGKVVTKIIDAIFGTDWSGGLSSLQSKVIAWGKSDNAITLSRDAPTISSLTGGKVGRWAYGDAWDTGYNAGVKVDNAIANFDPTSLFDKYIPDVDNYKLPDTSKYTSTPTSKLDDIASDTDSIAKNTVDVSDEELKYLRDIAERETINRFTTATVSVNFGGVTNNVASDTDLDGILAYFSDTVAEQLEAVAEGVH